MNPEEHPRLAEVYDLENRWGPDDDRFLEIAAEHPDGSVLDLGCGTGRLTIALAAAGHPVTGVDPNATSLAAARAKPGAERVTWINGTVADVDPMPGFDVALMTSHVAQVFVDDDEWASTLEHLARRVVPGGTLAFDIREPERRAWERWTKGETTASYELATGGAVTTWVDTTEVDAERGIVTFDWVNRFDDGEVVAGTGRLAFRSRAEIERDLDRAGFDVTRYDDDVEIVVATRRR